MYMKDVFDELKKRMGFKAVTRPGDIILVGMQSGLFYGIVHNIVPNVKRNWFYFSFKLLIIPPVDMTWILRIPQMTGEIFTINGEQHFVVAVDTNFYQKKKLTKKGGQALKKNVPKLKLVRSDKLREE